MKTKIITIPCNHQIKEIIETVDKDTLFKNILATKNQRFYTSFTYDSKKCLGETVRHIVICKNCGKIMPAYPEYRKSYPKRIIDTKTAISIFTHEHGFHDDILTVELFEPMSKGDNFTCLNCGTEDVFSEITKDIYVKWNKNIITISHIIQEPYQLRNIDYIYFSDVRPETPATESITFNFNKGSTFIEIKDCHEKTIFVKDITENMDPNMYSSDLIETISTNKDIKTFLRRLFEEKLGYELPYHMFQLEFYTFKNLTAFQGFSNKIFYSGIPIDSKTNNLDKDYKCVFKKLRTKSFADNHLMTKSFSVSSEIKEYIHENPFFWFYIDEIDIFYKTFNSDAIFCRRFLENKNCIYYLDFIHKHPYAIEFFKEYVKIKGCSEFLNLLADTNREKLRNYIFEFITLNPTCKQQEIKKLKNSSFLCVIDEYADSTNYPIIVGSLHINTGIERKINGYCFSALNFNYEYLLSQNNVNNPWILPKHCDLTFPIIKVSFGNEIVAIFQVYNNEVQQIGFSKFEDFLDADHNFIKAFVKWCSLNNISRDWVLPQKLLTEILNKI